MPDRTKCLTIEYRLPVTVVRFTGVVVTATDGLKVSPVTREIEANLVVDIRADSRSNCSLSVLEQDLGELTLSLKLLQDGRLSGSETEFDDQSGERLTAALSAGISTTSALLPFLSGAGAPGVAAALAVGAGATLGGLIRSPMNLMSPSIAVRSARNDEAGQKPVIDDGTDLSDQELVENGRVLDLLEPKTRTRPSAADVGIEFRFGRDQPAAHKTLHGYRVALLYLSQAHADQAERAAQDPEGGANALRCLDRALHSTREEASRVEEIYRVWRTGYITREKERVDKQLFIDDIPDTATFLTQVREPPRDREAPKWWDLAEKLRMMITCDLDVPDSSPDGHQGTMSFADGTILHRVPVQARLTTWRLRPSKSSRGWVADSETTEWILVAHPKGTRATRLPVKGADRQLAVEFSENGAMTSVQTQMKGVGVQSTATLAGLPASLSAAVSNGTAVGTGLSPAAARATALKARVEELEQRAKFQGLLNPATDSLADLRKELAEAELQARLSLAQRVTTDPSSVIILTRQPIPDSDS